VPAQAELRRIVDARGRARSLPPLGLVLSAMLGRVLGVGPGDRVTVEVLEGRRPVREVTVAALVDDAFGLMAYMEIEDLRALMGEGGTLSGAALAVDQAREEDLSERLKELPVVAGVALKRTVVENFQRILDQNMGLMISMNVIFAAVIACGVTYNAARVSLSERTRELASLRVLGYTRAEISVILLGELAVLTALALPLGAVLGRGLAGLVVRSVESEFYRFQLVITPGVLAWSGLVVVAAAVVSGLIVRRRLDRLDLIGVLKTRE